MEPVCHTFRTVNDLLTFIKDPDNKGREIRFLLAGKTQYPLVVRIAALFDEISTHWFSLYATHPDQRALLISLRYELEASKCLDVGLRADLMDYFRCFSASGFDAERSVVETPDYVKCVTHSQNPSLNGILFNYSVPALPKIQEEMSFYKSLKLPFTWYVESEGEEDIELLLQKKGFKAGSNLRIYTREIEKIPIRPLKKDVQLIVRELFNSDEITFAITALDPQMKPFFLYDAAQAKRRFIHFIIEKDSNIIACMTAIKANSIFYIVNAYTHPAYRNQGLQKRLFRFAAIKAVMMNCNTAIALIPKNSIAEKVALSFSAEYHLELKPYLSPDAESQRI